MLAVSNIVAFVCLTGGAIALWVLASLSFSSRIERPKNAVIEKRSDGGLEIRQYETYIITMTNLFRTLGGALNHGFGIIADCIFGNNLNSSYAIIRDEGSLLGCRPEMTAHVLSAG